MRLLPRDEEFFDLFVEVANRNKEAAHQYLAWEVNLIAQLDELELKSFRLPPSSHPTTVLSAMSSRAAFRFLSGSVGRRHLDLCRAGARE